MREEQVVSTFLLDCCSQLVHKCLRTVVVELASLVSTDLDGFRGRNWTTSGCRNANVFLNYASVSPALSVDISERYRFLSDDL